MLQNAIVPHIWRQASDESAGLTTALNLIFYMLMIKDMVLAVTQAAAVRAVTKLHLWVRYVSDATNRALVKWLF